MKVNDVFNAFDKSIKRGSSLMMHEEIKFLPDASWRRLVVEDERSPIDMMLEKHYDADCCDDCCW